MQIITLLGCAASAHLSARSHLLHTHAEPSSSFSRPWTPSEGTSKRSCTQAGCRGKVLASPCPGTRARAAPQAAIPCPDVSCRECFPRYSASFFSATERTPFYRQDLHPSATWEEKMNGFGDFVLLYCFLACSGSQAICVKPLVNLLESWNWAVNPAGQGLFFLHNTATPISVWDLWQGPLSTIVIYFHH